MCFFHWSVLRRVWLILCIINFVVWVATVTKEVVDHNGVLKLKQIFYILSRFLLEFLSCYVILGYAVYARNWMYTKPGVALEGGLLLYYLLRYSPWAAITAAANDHNGPDVNRGPIIFHNYYELAQILSAASFWCLSVFCIIKFYFYPSGPQNGCLDGFVVDSDENLDNEDREQQRRNRINNCGDNNRIIFESDYTMIAQCQKLNPSTTQCQGGEGGSSKTKRLDYSRGVGGYPPVGPSCHTVKALPANGNGPTGSFSALIGNCTGGRTSTDYYSTEYPIGDYGSILRECTSPQVPLSSAASTVVQLSSVLPPVSSAYADSNTFPSTSRADRLRQPVPPPVISGYNGHIVQNSISETNTNNNNNNNNNDQKRSKIPCSASNSKVGSGNDSSMRSKSYAAKNINNRNGGLRFMAQSLRR